MRFQEPLRMVEAARAELERARSNSEVWSDDLRQRFDAQRFKPLTDAGTKLDQALKKAQEKVAASERLLAM